MITINTISATKFSFNGITYHKNFMPFVVGNKISIVNVYDSCIELTEAPTIYSDYTVNGVTYGSVTALQSALLDVLYTRLSLATAITGTLTTNYLPKATGSTTLGNSSIYDNGGNDTGVSNASYSQFILKGNGTNDIGGGVLKFSNQTKDFAQITGETESANNGMILIRSLTSGSITEKIRILSNGNVGIGTTAPASIGGFTVLAVNGSTGGLFDLMSSGTTYGRLYSIPNNLIIEGVGASNIQFSANGAERMRITSSGNVGINTTAPTSKLQVVGLPSYADNVAALAGGLTVGAFYHTAGVLKVVI